MKTKAVRLYGKQDLRLEEFELPEIQDDEILGKVVSDSLCMSSYKAAIQGPDHKRVPNNVAENPVIIGHEFCGEIIKVGAKWADKYKVGDRFTVQPATNYKGSMDSPGYSFKYIGGDATYIVIPHFIMECDCLLPYKGDAFFYGSLSEPMSCIVGAYHANYHTKPGVYKHDMGIVEGGNLAILAGAGPMGLGAVDYAVHCDRKPALVVVTDVNQERLDRAASIITPESAAEYGVKLIYVNTGAMADVPAELIALTGGKGYNDVYVYAPVAPVVQQGDAILAQDGCLNFFAGPTNQAFSAPFNFYNVHYKATHVAGTSGGSTDDMRESIAMMEKGLINPAAMITHVGGLDSVAAATLGLHDTPGGKRLVYTHISMPMTPIADFEKLGENDKFFADLAVICKKHNMLWSKEAEDYVLANGKYID